MFFKKKNMVLKNEKVLKEIIALSSNK